MPKEKIFLSAEWKNLLMANYVCDPDVLKKYIPAKTELDPFEGNNFVSLIAFQFLQTRILGIQFPFHTNFVEVNLRFYVRLKENNTWKRGVVFIREVVPKFMISLIANYLYKENYRTMFTGSEITLQQNEITAQYSWGKNNSMHAIMDNKKRAFLPNSLEEFITEHYWGFSKVTDSKTNVYAVEHPAWFTYPVLQYDIHCNMLKMGLSDFNFINNEKPHSVLFAEGSKIIVRMGKPLSP